jgi:hypothetical protein
MYRDREKRLAPLIVGHTPVVLHRELPGMGMAKRYIIAIADDSHAPPDSLCAKLSAANIACDESDQSDKSRSADGFGRLCRVHRMCWRQFAELPAARPERPSFGLGRSARRVCAPNRRCGSGNSGCISQPEEPHISLNSNVRAARRTATWRIGVFQRDRRLDACRWPLSRIPLRPLGLDKRRLELGGTSFRVGG